MKLALVLFLWTGMVEASTQTLMEDETPVDLKSVVEKVTEGEDSQIPWGSEFEVEYSKTYDLKLLKVKIRPSARVILKSN
jgi:hypothetical protein